MTTKNALAMKFTKVRTADRFERLYTAYQADDGFNVGDLTIMLNSWRAQQMYTVKIRDDEDDDDDVDDEQDELPVILCLTRTKNPGVEKMWGSPFYYQIDFLWVDPACRGQYIGHYVMEQLIEIGQFNDHYPLTVRNPRSLISFFLRFGFITTDTGIMIHEPQLKNIGKCDY